MVKRIDVNPNWSGAYLVRLLERGRAKSLSYADDFRQDLGWIKAAGHLTVGTEALELSSRTTATGASAFLDGAEHWRDYLYAATLDWQRGQSVSLLARFQDSEHFVACTFTDAGVRIEERVTGVNRIVATSTLDVPIDKSSFAAAIRVAGQRAACLIGDTVVVSGSGLNPLFRRGSIGFKTWDPVPGQSTIRVRQISVTATTEESPVTSRD
jgi:hypothetical protein